MHFDIYLAVPILTILQLELPYKPFMISFIENVLCCLHCSNWIFPLIGFLLNLTAILFTCIPLPPLLSFSESAALASKEKDRNTDKGIKNKSRDTDNNSNINRDHNGKS